MSKKMADCSSPPRKRRRSSNSPDSSTTDGKCNQSGESVHQNLRSFEGFTVARVLDENPSLKKICVQGNFKEKPGDAVIILEKAPFESETLGSMLSESCNLKQIMHNDIYGTYGAFPATEFNSVKMTLIHPATAAHVAKYKKQHFYIIEETKDDYEQITRPYMKKSQIHFGNEWVFNILDHKAEEERIIFEDPDRETGFILLPDIKWNQSQLSDLYVIAIPHKRNLRSLRNLTAEHLPLLENILNVGTEEIVKKYDIAANKLRIYIHYLPSYYHLHIHFTHVEFDAPGSRVERAHLLTTVINNIKKFPSYYQEMSLAIVLAENNDLIADYKKAGRL